MSTSDDVSEHDGDRDGGQRPICRGTPEIRIPVAARIAEDLNRFLDGIEADRSIDPKSIKLNNTVAEIAERIAQAYELKRAGK